MLSLGVLQLTSSDAWSQWLTWKSSFQWNPGISQLWIPPQIAQAVAKEHGEECYLQIIPLQIMSVCLQQIMPHYKWSVFIAILTSWGVSRMIIFIFVAIQFEMLEWGLWGKSVHFVWRYHLFSNLIPWSIFVVREALTMPVFKHRDLRAVWEVFILFCRFSPLNSHMCMFHIVELLFMFYSCPLLLDFNNYLLLIIIYCYFITEWTDNWTHPHSGYS